MTYVLEERSFWNWLDEETSLIFDMAAVVPRRRGVMLRRDRYKRA
jgi:hypothetical protein